MSPFHVRSFALLSLALPFAACASGSPMKLVPVDVDPANVQAEVYLHEDLEGAVQFEPIRTMRTAAANLLNVQCRMVSTTGSATSGSYSIEFFDAGGRRLSSTQARPWSMAAGGYFLIEGQADSANATRLTLSVR